MKTSCEICKKELKFISNRHLKIHNLSIQEYRKMFPNSGLFGKAQIPAFIVNELCKEYEKGSGPKRLSKKYPYSGMNIRKVLLYSNVPFRPRGSKHTEIAKELIKEKRATQVYSEEAKKKMSNSHKGKTIPEEQRKKISLSLQGRPKDPEAIEKTRQAHIGTTWSEETRKKINRKKTEEHKRKLSEKSKELWKTEAYIQKQSKTRAILPNRPERGLLELLNKLFFGEWKYTGDYSFMINGRFPDFVNINGQKKIIELFGDYWHKGQDPQDRIDMFTPFGYDTLVVWEHELDNTKALTNKLIGFCKGG